MLLEIILVILLGVIGIINVSLNEKLERIEIMMNTFSKRYGLLFTPYDKKENVTDNNKR